jgi:hypothetical protein
MTARASAKGRQLRQPYFAREPVRRALHALTTVKTGSGNSNALIQCNVQYRARAFMAGIVIQNRPLRKSNSATGLGDRPVPKRELMLARRNKILKMPQ